MSRASVFVLALMVLLPGMAHATTAGSHAYSIYFSASADTGSDESAFFAQSWSSWLKTHRAIEKFPSLRRRLLHLPPDPYEGRKGARQLIHKSLSAKLVKAQPAHVYVLQLGVYESSRGVAAWMKNYWPKVAKLSLYEKTPKRFRVGYDSEANYKTQPLFLLRSRSKGKPAWRLCHGIYASGADAQKDARQFSRHLHYPPALLRRPLTARLARAIVFDVVIPGFPK